ncbi:hypothetical protein MBANPS3_011618 [Mucor bainieri]
MIPAALAILIYQVLAILGVEARDLDYKLMYLQSPLDLVWDHKRFSQTSTRKLSIALLTCLALVLKFIPTIMTKLNSSASIYYDMTATPLDQAEATSIYNWPSTMPVFDNFVPYLVNPNLYSLQDILSTYIKEKLHQNVTSNNDGHWFTPNIARRFEWDNQQGTYEGNFVAPPKPALILHPTISQYELLNPTAIAFENDFRTSFTTSMCIESFSPGAVPSYTDNEIFNISTVHGAAIRAARKVLKDCIPVYDRSLVIKTAYHTSETGVVVKPSLLNANDTLYRLPQFSEGITASSSFGVSIFNHNTTHMTLGIKKTAHITLYTHGKNATPPLDCTSAGRTDTSNNFVDLPYDGILCTLVDLIRTHPDNLHFAQAALRVYVGNYALDMLYSLRKYEDFWAGRVANTSDALMVDFTVFQTFNVEGNLKDNQEHMVAFSTNSLNYATTSDIETATDFSNDKIGTLLKSLDPSRIDQDTVNILVGMASMRVRWENGDYSDINLNKAQVMNGIQTPTWWIIAVCAMALIFLLPQFSRLIVRRIPAYAESLRTLLLMTIEQPRTLEGLNSKAKSIVGLSLPSNNDEDGHTALLSVNGHQVTLKEISTRSLAGSSTDERAIIMSESYKHPNTSCSPLLQ